MKFITYEDQDAFHKKYSSTGADLQQKDMGGNLQQKGMGRNLKLQLTYVVVYSISPFMISSLTYSNIFGLIRVFVSVIYFCIG